MSAHAPYLMPDGGKLSDVLRSDRSRGSNKGGSGIPGKHAQANLVSQWTAKARSNAESGVATNAQELAELRALEAVGVRRRRRWLNEKQLRDNAGPMSAADMVALFNPVPFGVVRDSPLTQIREDPAAAAVWEGFRNIDEDKEARVLQKWEEFNAKLAAGEEGVASRVVSPAAAALHSWSAVSKTSRAALRKANVHSVLALETQVMELLEKGDTSASLIVPLEDAFGRMLVHGLAQFHGLASTSLKGQECSVSVHFRPQQQQQQQVVSAPAETQATAQQPIAPLDDTITCTDVLMALAELGSSGLTHNGLGSFVRKHVHGISSGATSEAEWVMM